MWAPRWSISSHGDRGHDCGGVSFLRANCFLYPPEALAMRLARRLQKGGGDGRVFAKDMAPSAKPLLLVRMMKPFGLISLANDLEQQAGFGLVQPEVSDRNSGGHADHFWSMALAVHAGTATPRCDFEVIRIPGRLNIPRWSLI